MRTIVIIIRNEDTGEEKVFEEENVPDNNFANKLKYYRLRIRLLKSFASKGIEHILIIKDKSL